LLCVCTVPVTLEIKRLVISVSSVIHLSVTYITLPRYAGCGEMTSERFRTFCVFLKLEISIVLKNYRYMKYWVAQLPRILSICVLSKHSDSPAVTWAESDGLWKLKLMCLPVCNLALKLLSQNNWRIWWYLDCQIDAKLST